MKQARTGMVLRITLAITITVHIIVLLSSS